MSMVAKSEQESNHELTFYTLAHSDPAFIHQHAVDAFAAQTADANTKPITVVFALIGLYLYIEKGFTGKQVQRAHMKMARYRKEWPKLPLPEARGAVRIADVLAAGPGAERDAMIRCWCNAVWHAWQPCRNVIVALAKDELGVDPSQDIRPPCRPPASRV